MSSLPADLRAAFARYTVGPSLVRQAVTGANPGSLNRPGPDGWSARDVIVHLADFELADGFAHRSIVATGPEADVPAIDAQRWRRRLSYLWRDAEAALALFELLRFSNAEIIQHADSEALERHGRRGDRPLAAADILRTGAAHAEEHAEQVRRLVGA